MNEIVQPVTRGFYFMLFAILAVGTIASLLVAPVSATIYKDGAEVTYESGNSSVLSYRYPSEPNPYCGEYPCSAVVNRISADDTYIDCSVNPSGAILGKWILDGMTNCVGGGAGLNQTCTNVCPAGRYFSWTRITGNGTWCNGGIQCYDTQIFASWESIETPGVNITFSNATIPGQTFIRTYVQAVDGLTSGAIHGSDIQIKDNINNVWVNVTNQFDGTSSILTNTTTTIDAYAEAIGYSSGSRLGLTPGDLVYEIIMWPTTAFLDPGVDNVNLAIIVNDKLTAAPIQSASVAVTIPSGATTGGSTNAAGTETFVVPNMSVIHVTVKKTGYTTASTTVTTSAFGPDTKRIELVKATVTPTITATPLPGEVTVRPTLDTRTGNQKDADMMEQIRDAGPTLIQLAILATIVGLGKLMIK